MPISALVITLDNRENQRALALRCLANDPRIYCGEAHGSRIPAVLETNSLSEGRRLCDELQRQPGVQFIDVISINFEDSELENNATPPIS